MMTTRVLPPGLSSSGRKLRPITGVVPSTVRKSEVTARAFTTSISPALPRLTLAPVSAAIAVNVWLRCAELGPPTLRIALVQTDKAIGVFERERAQHHRIDYAEDRRVCADSDRERQYDDRRKPRILSNHPKPEAKILP